MAKKTDLKGVQAALDRAAQKAVDGPRDARAGRFVAARNTSVKSVAASTLSERSPKRK